MFPALSPSDFTGVLKLTGSEFAAAKFQDYIDQKYFDAVELFIGNAAATEVESIDPLPQKWADLFNGVSYFNVRNELTFKIKGLAESVKEVIYFHIVRDNFVSSPSGKVKEKSEVSDKLSNLENSALVANRYNSGVRIYNTQILQFLDNYHDFSQPIIGLTDNGGGNYTLLTTATKYLADGDKVRIGLYDYTVSNVVTDTSFDVSGNVPIGTEYLSNPYSIVCYGYENPVFA